MTTRDLFTTESRPAPELQPPADAAPATRSKRHPSKFSEVMDETLQPDKAAGQASNINPGPSREPRASRPQRTDRAGSGRPHTPAQSSAPEGRATVTLPLRSAAAVATAEDSSGSTAQALDVAGTETDPASPSPAETLAAQTADPALLITNIIPFPTPSVIIPFPGLPPKQGAGDTSLTDTAPPVAGSDQRNVSDEFTPAPPQAPTAITAAPTTPRNITDNTAGAVTLPASARANAATGATPENVTPVNFNRPEPKPSPGSDDPRSAIIPVAFGPAPVPDQTPPTPPAQQSSAAPSHAGQDAAVVTVTELPGPRGEEEQSTQSNQPAPAPANVAQERRTPGKRPASAVATHSTPGRNASAAVDGIGAAKVHGGMDSLTNSKAESDWAASPEPTAASPTDEAGASENFSRTLGATEWQTGRPIDHPDRPASAALETARPASPETVEKVSKLLLRESSLIRGSSSDSMAVVLRPDAHTELVVHLTQRNGQVEAAVRCERGDWQQLSGLWPQLQESLAQQKVRLAPLQESSATPPAPDQASGFGSPRGDDSPGRKGSSPQESMDERPAPASPNSGSVHVRGRQGSRHRLTTSRPGWETWA